MEPIIVCKPSAFETARADVPVEIM